MSTATLLVELFTEELPPKVLKRLGDAFASVIQLGLAKRGMLEADAIATMFATPRRLAVRITGVHDVGADQVFTEKLMPVAVGVDRDGNATPALLKKLAARSLGHVPPEDLLRESDGKVDQLVYRGKAKGQSLQAALQNALEEAITALPVPKVMSYQLADGVTTVQFVRPAHGLVALHGAEVIPVHALGLDAGRTTHGHRFQGAADIELQHADEFESRLETEGGVIAGFDQRRKEIHRMLRERADQQLTTLGDYDDYQALLDEVSALVEMPTVYVGEFEREFLDVPAECLILTMKLNQKYFPLFLNEGGLSSRFLIVSNMRLDDPHTVIEGNQRVVRPRLADARFFFETDKKVKLADRIPRLASVVYHNRLGSQGERVEHVRGIAKAIAELTSRDLAFSNRVDDAARLAKADLVSDMVGEFPELQGTMGKYYALNEGISPEIADAIEDHYKPRFAGDSLPRNDVGAIVALADKFATLAGMFSIGQLPSGDKDPFALRRHAIGVVRILVEKQLPADVSALVGAAVQQFGSSIIAHGVESPNLLINMEITAQDARTRLVTAEKLTEFLFERFSVMLKDQGFTSQESEAVLSLRPQRFSSVMGRLKAVRAFSEMPEASSLAAANKRIGNILKKADRQFVNVDQTALVEPAERALFDAMQAARPVFDKFYECNDYANALKSVAPLKTPVDAFFDGVMVNVDDVTLRENRLALLGDLSALLNRVADLSKLAA